MKSLEGNGHIISLKGHGRGMIGLMEGNGKGLETWKSVWDGTGRA